jgi:hypothetical protein
MTIRQTIDIPVGLRHLDVPLPEECPVGRVNIEIHITPVRFEAGAETEAYTQYILRELAKTEKKIADGTVRWYSMEEFFADDDDGSRNLAQHLP